MRNGFTSRREQLPAARRRHPDQADYPKAHIGPIAGGEQVVVDVRSHSYEVIEQFYGDALVVEMEGDRSPLDARYQCHVQALLSLDSWLPYRYDAVWRG